MEKTCNKKILAQSLLEWTLGSKTTFFKAEDNQFLAEKAAKLGIEIPSPDLAAFETIYCEVDKFNLNGVKIPKKVAEKGIKTLIGKQVNWNHEGAHQICGYIIDAFIKEDKIYIDGILFKSLFKTEFDEVVQLFAEGKLFVSFELWNRKEDGSIIVKDLGNGQRELTEMVAHGCALLLIDSETGKPIPPACPRAQVQKLLASEQVITEAEEIVNSVFEKDERLVYAELATTNEELKPCSKCTCFEKEEKDIMAEEIKVEEILDNDYEGGEIEDAKKLTTEQRNALPDSDFALIQMKDGKKIRRFPINDEAHVRNALARLPQAKDISEEERKSALEKILKKAKELNMTELLKKYEKAEEQPAEEVKPEEIKAEEVKEEPKNEEKAQVTPEPAQVAEPAPIEEQKPAEQAQVVVEQPAESSRKLAKIVTYDGTETTTLFAETGETTLKKRRVTTIRYFTDGTDERSEHEEEAIETFTYSQLEEKVNVAKAEKDAEIATLKAEKEAKEIEVTNLKTELGAKDQEIVELKKPKVEIAKEEVKEEQPILEVGNTSTKTIDKYVERRKKINKKAYGHENNGM